MPTAEDVQRLYTRRARSYDGYVQAFGHRQGIAAALAASPGLALGLRILDAGCGTGLSIAALNDALRRRGLTYHSIDGFDLTPAMLDRCRATVQAAGVPRVELRQADVLHLGDQLPATWRDYDLVVCASMLEHVPQSHLTDALAALGDRLAPGGQLFIVVTRELFWATRWAWHCQGYSRRTIRSALVNAGIADVTFRYYPWTYGWLNAADHVIQARKASA